MEESKETIDMLISIQYLGFLFVSLVK